MVAMISSVNINEMDLSEELPVMDSVRSASNTSNLFCTVAQKLASTVVIDLILLIVNKAY